MKGLPAGILVLCFPAFALAAGLRGDPAAIAEARLMVESMGGVTIWAPLKGLHLVHRWYPHHRLDSYVEDEILDLTGPRSSADRKSEISRSLRVYSPEGGRWTLTNGELVVGSAEALESDLRRAPFNFFRLVQGVAADNDFYEIRFGAGDIPDSRRLEFSGPDGVLGGWVILNARREPIVKATPEYRYTLGPLQRYGNLLLPAWGVYDNGFTRYEMIAATGDFRAPEVRRFMLPADGKP